MNKGTMVFVSMLLMGCSLGEFAGETGSKKSDKNSQTAGAGSEDGLPAYGSIKSDKNSPTTGAGSGDDLPAGGENRPGRGGSADGANPLGGRLGGANDPASVQKNIGKCLTNWSSHPFGANPTPAKKIYASVSVMGNNTVAINDTDRTSTPALILIYAGVNVMGSVTYRLLNPNGWYCIVANVNVATDLTVELQKQAKLANTRVNVDVLSSTSGGTAGVGVNVLADVKVVRVD